MGSTNNVLVVSYFNRTKRFCRDRIANNVPLRILLSYNMFTFAELNKRGNARKSFL